MNRIITKTSSWVLFVVLGMPTIALAEGATAAKIDTGDTAWVLVSAAMVLFMTPGLAFFYGGMVRSKNVLSTLFQNYAALAVVGLLWAVCGYSLVFSGDHAGLIGDLNWAFLNGVGQEPNTAYAPTIPHLAFMIYQCMFAVITPALITGAFAERISFKAWLPFMALWALLVYFPVAHWVWGTGGWIHQMGGIDFAGGMVVHMSAGFSALVAAILLGKRRGFPDQENKPHDSGMILLGTALLWFGWFGFNAGSALGANGLAAQAFSTTFFASAAAMASWTLVDWIMKGTPSAVGAAVGAVAGLATVTPAAGFVTIGSAMLIGFAAGFICNFAVMGVKNTFKIDDTLDVFGCHGIGGTLGVVLTGVFATKSVNPAGADGLLYGGTHFFGVQCISALAIAAFSVVTTIAIIKLVEVFVPMRVPSAEEDAGLDFSQHSESIGSAVVPEGAAASS